MTLMLSGLLHGLQNLASPPVVLLMVVGMLAGTFVGVIPGLGGAVLLTMLLPFLYGMPVVEGLALMVAAHASIYFSGSITAILLNTPGAPESAPTTIDGYAMTRQGKAARALGISATATTLGGWIGFLALIAVIPLMFTLITVFHPPEYLLLSILAVVLVSQLRSGSVTKGLLSGSFGFLMAFVGYDPITGVQRFSFNVLGLYNGFNIVVVALGLFALGEMYHLFAAEGAMAQGGRLNLSQAPGARVLDGVRDVFGHLWLLLRSALIGVLVGVIPGVGGIAGNFISYGQAVRTSKHPERFGTGTPEGVIAPEASSLAKEAGAYIPTLALGVPSTVGTAVMLGALEILGVAPGPKMLTSHLPVVFSIAWLLAVTSLLASLVGLVLAPTLARVTTLPGPVLVPFVVVLGMIGAYASTTDMIQVFAVIGFGVVGAVMKRLDYSLPAAIIGFILGGVVQDNLYLTQRLYGWSFVRQPLADVLLLVIFAVLLSPVLRRRRQRAAQAAPGAPAGPGESEPSRPAAPGRPRRSRLELPVDLLWVGFTAWYVLTARTYPPTARLVPMLIGTAALVVAIVQLAGHFVPALQSLTLGRPASEPGPAGPSEPAGAAGPAEAASRHRRYNHRQLVAIAWSAGLFAGLYLFGYTVTVPAFMLLYFLLAYRRGWRLAVGSALGMWVLTYYIFQQALALHLPGGLVFHLMG